MEKVVLLRISILAMPKKAIRKENETLIPAVPTTYRRTDKNVILAVRKG